MDSAHLVAIAGPIGAGKSTLLKGLAAVLGAGCADEGIDDNPFFERFLADPAAWCFRSQLSFMLGSAENAAEMRRDGGTVVTERPIHEQLDIFCVEQLEGGLLSRDEYVQLERLVALAETAGATPDVLVLLEGPLDTLSDRIRARARAGEDMYRSEYLAQLHRRYEAWSASWTRSPVLRVDVVANDVRSLPDVTRIAEDVKAALTR